MLLSSGHIVEGVKRVVKFSGREAQVLLELLKEYIL
jgi:hypothetical protein